MSENYKTLQDIETADRKQEISYFHKRSNNKYSCNVEIKAPQNTNFSVIFAGLFHSPIPNHKPVVGKALFSKRSAILAHGDYYLLACGIEKSFNPVSYFDLSACYRGRIDSVLSFPNSIGLAAL